VAQVNRISEQKARVTKVLRDKNPYAVAQADGISGQITFSLSPDRKVWDEDEYPRTGTMVVLSDLRKNDNGWRAYKARFLRPEDEIDQATQASKKGP
jgi:hypothetical protein